VVNPLLQDTGERWISLCPVGELVKDEERRQGGIRQEVEAFPPCSRDDVSKGGQGIAEFFAKVQQLLLRGPLHCLVIEAAPLPTGFSKERCFPDAAAPCDVPKAAAPDVAANPL